MDLVKVNVLVIEFWGLKEISCKDLCFVIKNFVNNFIFMAILQHHIILLFLFKKIYYFFLNYFTFNFIFNNYLLNLLSFIN